MHTTFHQLYICQLKHWFNEKSIIILNTTQYRWIIKSRKYLMFNYLQHWVHPKINNLRRVLPKKVCLLSRVSYAAKIQGAAFGQYEIQQRNLRFWRHWILIAHFSVLVNKQIKEKNCWQFTSRPLKWEVILTEYLSHNFLKVNWQGEMNT